MRGGAARPISQGFARSRLDHRPPLAEGGTAESLLNRLPRPPFSLGVFNLKPTDTPRAEEQPLKAGPRTGGTRRQGTGKRRHRSEPGTSEDRPGTLQEHHEDREGDARTHMPVREGHVTRNISQPSPGSVGGGPSGPTTRRAESETTEPTARLTGNPHEPQRGVRGAFTGLRPDNRTPAFHTPP